MNIKILYKAFPVLDMKSSIYILKVKKLIYEHKLRQEETDTPLYRTYFLSDEHFYYYLKAACLSITTSMSIMPFSTKYDRGIK